MTLSSPFADQSVKVFSCADDLTVKTAPTYYTNSKQRCNTKYNKLVYQEQTKKGYIRSFSFSSCCVMHRKHSLQSTTKPHRPLHGFPSSASYSRVESTDSTLFPVYHISPIHLSSALLSLSCMFMPQELKILPCIPCML